MAVAEDAVACAGTPAKMTVKIRTPTPARRDFRSRVTPSAYDEAPLNAPN